MYDTREALAEIFGIRDPLRLAPGATTTLEEIESTVRAVERIAAS